MAAPLDFLLFAGALGLVVIGMRVAGSSSRRQTRRSLACRVEDAPQKPKPPGKDAPKNKPRPQA